MFFSGLVGATDRHGVGGRMKGKWEMEHQQGQAWDKPASLQRERGKKGIEETISYQSESPANGMSDFINDGIYKGL